MIFACTESRFSRNLYGLPVSKKHLDIIKKFVIIGV